MQLRPFTSWMSVRLPVVSPEYATYSVHESSNKGDIRPKEIIIMSPSKSKPVESDERNSDITLREVTGLNKLSLIAKGL
jgi:hypothetical protein